MKLRIILSGLLLIGLMSHGIAQSKVDPTVNFPREKVLVKKMPPKNHLWVFLMTGQSNMAGRAFIEPADTVPNPRILTIDKNNDWILAKEPIHFYEPTRDALDCGLSFGRELIKHLNDSISVAVIPCAVGGSSITQWNDDALFRHVKLLSNFREKVELAQKYGVIKGILWHQGESDAHPPMIAQYEKNLRTLVGKFRKIVGNDTLPVFVGELGRYAEPAVRHQHWTAINQKKKRYVESDPNAYLISSAGLTDRGDNTHFNTASQRELGKRFADKFLKVLHKQSADEFSGAGSSR